MILLIREFLAVVSACGLAAGCWERLFDTLRSDFVTKIKELNGANLNLTDCSRSGGTKK
jgi:hypothetical protein